MICESLIRQFEFAQNVWANDRNFHELANERDPIIGNQDGTLEFKIPKRPIRRTIKAPAFTTVRGGAYFFLPGLNAADTLATLSDGQRASQDPHPWKDMAWVRRARPVDLQARTTSRGPTRRAATFQHLLDVELSWEANRDDRPGQSLLDHDRGPPGRLAELRGSPSGTR